jgi:protein-S-isoprenylcysteine O-methyltransferase Ste14
MASTSGISLASERHDAPGVLASAPRLYGVAFVSGVVLNGAWPGPLAPPAVALAVGSSLLAGGALLAVSARRAMERSGTPVNPFQPATALVVTGPFRYSRNPHYLGRILLYVGLAFAMNTVWPLATLIPLVATLHYGVVKREERYLDGKFGEAYKRYCSRVPRWL